MAEGEAGQAAAQPSEVERAVASLREEVRAGIGGLAQGLQFVAEKTGVLEQAARERHVATPTPLPADANERMRKELWENPVGVHAQAITIAKQQAVAEARQMIEQEKQQAQNEAQWAAFWDRFYYDNPDIDRLYHATVVDLFQRVPGQVIDPSARANQAAIWMRERLHSQLATIQENERRKSTDAGVVSTGNAARDFMGIINPEGAAYDSQAHTDDYVARKKARLEVIQGRGKAA